jgi:tetratricopeptide (TPR) repeat protein
MTNICPMIRMTLLIVFVGLFASARAQTRKLDSLHAELQKIPVNNDTAIMKQRAALLLKISYGFTSIYNGANDFPKSREYSRQALHLYQQLKNENGLGGAYRSISFSYSMQGLYPQAIDTGLLALRSVETLRDTVNMIRLSSDIADAYSLMGNETEKALIHAKRCAEWSKSAGRKYGMCGCEALLASIYMNGGQLDSAEYNARAAMALAEQLGDKYVLPGIYFTMNEVERGRKRYDKEQEWLLKLEKILNEEKSFDSPYFKLNLLIRQLRNALDRNDFAAARRYRQLAAPLVPQVEDPTIYGGYYEDYSRLAEHDGQYADALRLYKTFVTIQDSINNKDKTRRVTQIQMNHEFERKQAAQTAVQERELALRDARNQQQRIFFGVLLLGLLGTGAFGFYAYQQKQERRRSELELANLRAQINPHFIFNCLNSIYRYTKERDTDTASKYLQKFSSLLRLVLENSRSEKITLARDLEALQLYADIEGLRFKEKLRFSIEMDPDIDPTFVEIPGMLIQPHVENAIWHGLMHRPAGGEIVVRLQQPQEYLLRVIIEDNGIGRAAAAELASKSATQQKSLGQKITAERLKATGKLANTETIDLYDGEGNVAGTRIVLDIPL